MVGGGLVFGCWFIQQARDLKVRFNRLKAFKTSEQSGGLAADGCATL